MRPSLDRYMIALATTAAARTTCIRRGVGCVLVNAKGYVLAIGYNGVASGMPHCSEPYRVGVDYAHAYYVELDGRQAEVTRPMSFATTHPHACIGHDLPPGKDSCEAVHAEQNALLQCRDSWVIDTAYITLSPCKSCLKLLLNTSCRRIVFLEEHIDLTPKELWQRTGRVWQKFSLDAAVEAKVE